MQQLRELATAENEEHYTQLVMELKSTPLYTGNELFRNWFLKKWLNEEKRWAFCFRMKVMNIITTTNGIESQFKEMKHFYLKEFGVGKSLQNVLEVLLEKFFPDAELSYKRDNVRALEESRQYSEAVPDFLKNRPSIFFHHCIKRVPPNIENIQMSDIDIVEHHFEVKSQESHNKYIVSVEGDFPTCTCQDFIKTHWPCKHMLAIYKHFNSEPIGAFLQQPLFTVDRDIVHEHTVDRDIVHEHEPVRKDSSPEILEFNVEKKVQPKPQSVRKDILQTLSNLENLCYLCDDVVLLDGYLEKLKCLKTSWEQTLPKVAGLTLRRNKRRWRRRSGRYSIRRRFERKTGRRIVKRKREPDSKATADETVIIDGTVEECEKTPMPNEKTETNERVSTMEQLPNSMNSVACGAVGPYTLYPTSFASIRTLVTDEVIDAYLHLITQNRGDIYHINCVVMTSIFCGRGNIHLHSLLQQVNIDNYTEILGAINEGGNHWSLVIIRPTQKILLYLNPMGEILDSKQKLLQNWYAFLKLREEAGVQAAFGSWSIDTLPHCCQIDGSSCGIYVLKFAENYLLGNTLTVNWTKFDLIKIREEVSSVLLAAIGQPEDDHHTLTSSTNIEAPREIAQAVRKRKKRRMSSFIYQDQKKIMREIKVFCKCKQPYDKKKFMIYCEGCQEWFHLDCIGCTTKDVPRKKKKFYCPECKMGTAKVDHLNEETLKKIINHVKEITSCSKVDCKEEEHQRHHGYLKQPIGIHRKCMKRCGFGLSQFPQKFIESLGENLISRLVVNLYKDKRKPYTGGRYSTLKGLVENSHLGKMLYEKKTFAVHYVMDVLLNEGLIYIYRQQSNLEYTEAQEHLSSSEVVLK
ncbi:hypothetical protein ScPMuIL_003487 [Solemya velum]